MMLKIGLTGGIGSGKTYIGRIFKSMNVPVYDSDYEAKRLMSENGELRQRIIGLFGTDAFESDQLNRKYISDRVFKDEQLLTSLNSIVHPAVHNDFLNWADRQESSVSYVIKEAAILIETGGHDFLDYTILVVADEETRIRRVMERDAVSRRQVKDRIENQMKDNEKLKFADFIIYNENDSMILKQIVDLHQEILNKQKD